MTNLWLKRLKKIHDEPIVGVLDLILMWTNEG